MARASKVPSRCRLTPQRPAGCDKLGYEDKAAAKVALRNVRSARRHQVQQGRRDCGKTGERRTYHCPRCGMWHLTSMEPELNANVGRRLRGLADG